MTTDRDLLREKIESLYVRARAGKDPETGKYHISPEDFYNEVVHLLEQSELKSRISELKKAKDIVATLRDVYLTQDNKLDGSDSLVEKVVAIRNHLREEINQDIESRIAELQKGIKK